MMLLWIGAVFWPVLLGITSGYSLSYGSWPSRKFIRSQRASVAAGECLQSPATVTIPVGDYADFSSPNFPTNYNAFQRCSWKFQTDADAQLWLSCDSVYMSWFAFLYVIDQGTKHKKGCFFCGSNPESFQYMVRTNTATVGLENNLWFNNKGFSCRATALAKPTNDDCNCGEINSNRIIGGTETEPNQYPWMALLVRPGSNYNFCGGSLITDEFVLTAAHCTEGTSYHRIQVRLGIHDKLSNPPDSLRRDALQIIEHASYNSVTLVNDVALVRISPVDFSSHPNIRPICLPAGSDNYALREAIVAGWGTNSTSGSIVTSEVLLAVAIPVIHPDMCVSYLGSRVTSGMVCAGSEGLDSCQGDSGGPLFLSEGSGYQVVIGIVSWGVGCGIARYPGVYTRVTAYRSWIESRLDGSTACPKP